jgi:protein-export membrane protein SecD
VTRDNVGKPFAIVLDGEVISAPVIREPILGGSGEISGRYTVQSASDLAVLLRSGALPAKPKLEARTTVGPTMGADSIASGKTATLWAFLLVAIFMVIGYGLFGAFSIVALTVNIAIIMATMSLLGGTLTLPGIAGIALTMGVAVDANVLIFERMREELRSGKSNILALEAGFSRAYATILDSHLTGLLGGVILMWLGTGPIRGFAITLSIGIVASLFTAVTLTRLIIATWVRYVRPNVIPL